MSDINAGVFEALFDEDREFESKPPADVDGEPHEEKLGDGDTHVEIVAAGAGHRSQVQEGHRGGQQGDRGAGQRSPVQEVRR